MRVWVYIMIGLFTIFVQTITGHSAPPIKVGEINSYSGVAASFTGPYKEAVNMAVEEINAKGGLLGGRKLHVIFRDDKFKPDEAVKHAQELVFQEKVNFLMGTFASHVGLAVSAFSEKNRILFVAAEPLTDALTWAKGHRYVFRVRPNTYQQGRMLAEKASKLPYRRWVNIGPNYEYGRKCWEGFWTRLKELRPDCESIAEFWPKLGEGEYSSFITSVLQARPEAVFCSLFGSDWIAFVKQAKNFGLFKDIFFVGILLGEPEYIEPLGKDAPEGMLVTGYPYYSIKSPEHDAFLNAYTRRTGVPPRLGSLVGYITMISLAEAIRSAGTIETEKVVDAFENLKVLTPAGYVQYRTVDHHSTFGAWVGYTKLDPLKGHGIMVDWEYWDGGRVLPSPQEILKMRGK